MDGVAPDLAQLKRGELGTVCMFSRSLDLFHTQDVFVPRMGPPVLLPENTAVPEQAP